MAKRNYEQIALLVLTQPTLKMAAEKAGISYKTLTRYRKNPEFQAVLQAEKVSIFHDTMQKAQAYTMEALETLREIQNNSTLNESARVSAAKGILELGTQLHSMEAIEAELAELRKAVMDDEKD